jgi:type II secretory pathway component PulJ
MQPRAPRSSEAGFTLTELLVAGLMVVILFMGVVGAMQIGSQTTTSASAQTDAQQAIRVAMERVTRDIRGAGFDPRDVGTAVFTPITAATATTLTLQSDLNANGLIDPAPGAGVCDPTAAAETVRYRLLNGVLLRSVNPPVLACETAVVGGVNALAFRYFGENDAELVNPPAADQIRIVTVTLTLVPAFVSGPAQQTSNATMTDRARLRNR